MTIVDPLAIVHSTNTCKSAKPLSFKADLSSNMTILLGYTPVGWKPNVFKPKRNTKSKGWKGSKAPAQLDPQVYPTVILSTDVNPYKLSARITHEFGRAGGMFFQQRPIQCLETSTLYTIFYLYTFAIFLQYALSYSKCLSGPLKR
jgi:hypothetical protein